MAFSTSTHSQDEIQPSDPGAEPLINDPGNEDPGSIEVDALVPLLEDDDTHSLSRSEPPS